MAEQDKTTNMNGQAPEAQAGQDKTVYTLDESKIGGVHNDPHGRLVPMHLKTPDAEGLTDKGFLVVHESEVSRDKDVDRKSYFTLDHNKDYKFMSSLGQKDQYFSGSSIAEMSKDYQKELQSQYFPDLGEKPSKAQAAQKKPSAAHLLRVNDSMIKDTRQNGLKAVTIGLLDADGNKKVGTIFVGDKQVNADKKTTELPKSQQKSYVALDRSKDYTFSVRGPKDAEGKPTYENSKVSGADIIEQNKAYMRDKAAERTKNLEQSVESPAPEAQAEAGY